ncbi:DUF1638 domain-containing protein [Breznakiellaceae bacterium SP9]
MIPVLSCGIFQWELEKILPEIEKELGKKIMPKFLPAALDESEPKLEAALKESSSSFNNQNFALLYGSMCHTNMAGIAKECKFVHPVPANCAAIILGPEKKKELDALGNFYYLSSYGLREWRTVYKIGHGWDEADARVNFGYFEKINVLDTGVIEITDEELFDFYEYAQIPVEAEKISLDHFKEVVLDLLKRV